MSGYQGDFPASAVVRIPFHSFNSSGASVTASSFAASDVLIYKNGGTTQRSSAAGITVTTDFDSQTGLHFISIDTSDNTDASFYAAGNEYHVAVADVTIDSQTVRFWAGSFSIQRSGGALATLLSATHGLAALKTLIDTLDNFVDTEIADIQARLPAALVSGRIDASVGAMASGTVTAAAVATGAIDADALATDAVTEIVTAVLTTAMTEAYSTKNGTVTLAQFVHEVLAQLQESDTNGTTTSTVKKRDQSTTAFTLTLDNAVEPTSVTRAT